MPALIPIAASVAGAAISANSAKKNTQMQIDAQKEAAKPDPRVDSMLWGQGPQLGLMQQYRNFLDAPQSDAMKQFGEQSGQFLQQNGLNDMNAMRNASLGLMNGMSTPQAAAANYSISPQANGAQAAAGPQVTASGAPVLWNKGETFNAPNPMQSASVAMPQGMQAAQTSAASVSAPPAMQTALAHASQVNAPSQNSIDLTGSYQSLLGSAGDNPFLTGAIQKGINQSANAFGAMQRDSTQNLLENVMPSIRGGAVIAGGYGGSRQGIAEGRALDSFAKEQQRAMSQFGQNNTDAAVSAQAGAYDADRNRALSATQGLGAQQYGVASQNSAQAQQAAMANAAARNNTNQANYQGGLAANMANAGYQQQSNLANQASTNNANQTNYQGGLSAAMANAGYNQQANATNYAGQLQTNQQNASNLQQANLANQNAGNTASMFGASATNAANLANAQMGQQNNQYNANLAQNNNQFNAGLHQQTQMANLGNLQQTNLANLQAQMGMNQLNTNRVQSGMAGLSGILGTAYQNAGNQDNYALNRAQGVNSLLYPYLGKTQAPQPAPVYSNTAGAAMGGGLMGLQLAQGLMGGGGGTSVLGGNAMSGWSGFTPPPLSTNPGALQNLSFLGGQ